MSDIQPEYALEEMSDSLYTTTNAKKLFHVILADPGLGLVLVCLYFFFFFQIGLNSMKFLL